MGSVKLLPQVVRGNSVLPPALGQKDWGGSRDYYAVSAWKPGHPQRTRSDWQGNAKVPFCDFSIWRCVFKKLLSF